MLPVLSSLVSLSKGGAFIAEAVSAVVTDNLGAVPMISTRSKFSD